MSFELKRNAITVDVAHKSAFTTKRLTERAKERLVQDVAESLLPYVTVEVDDVVPQRVTYRLDGAWATSLEYVQLTNELDYLRRRCADAALASVRPPLT